MRGQISQASAHACLKYQIENELANFDSGKAFNDNKKTVML